MTIDLWSDNAGGLYLVSRDHGLGWQGMERAQNDAVWLRPQRTFYRFIIDAEIVGAGIDDGDDPDTIIGGGVHYTRMLREHVAMLYELNGIGNEAVKVASWNGGIVTLHVNAESLGASARWYLAEVVP